MGKKFFESLKKGLEEAIAHDKGEITLRPKEIELPSPPKYTAKYIKRIRAREHYSQGVFAKILNVSPKTIQAWESGLRVPSQATLYNVRLRITSKTKGLPVNYDEQSQISDVDDTVKITTAQ
jgi:putative transcriptional regulator